MAGLKEWLGKRKAPAAGPAPAPAGVDVLRKFSAQIGELAQHHLVAGSDLQETGDWYHGLVTGVIDRAGRHLAGRRPPRFLEIGCWQHVLGYRLAQERGFESTLFDICDVDLERGRDAARAMGLGADCDRVVGDFHDLPFADGYFDFAMISAAIHHTRTPERIVGEMMRVLSGGGLFYCQREPADRLFCFYRFAANRPHDYTPFERHLHERDVMRLFSSPFPGARNAELFDRIENDRITVDRYYELFAPYGRVEEEVLYSEGLLTAMDREILERADLPMQELADFIERRVMEEVALALPLLGRREWLMGYSLPSPKEVRDKAAAVAAALKARPADANTVAWQKAMVRIFGGSLRFVVRRNGSARNSRKLRRPCTEKGAVRFDDAVYVNSGLRFWDALLPDVQQAGEPELRERSFPAPDWRLHVAANGNRAMLSTARSPTVELDLPTRAVVVMRIRLVVGGALEAAYLDVECPGNARSTSLAAMTEDRMLRFVVAPGPCSIRFTVRDPEGRAVDATSRIAISILQAIPLAA